MATAKITIELPQDLYDDLLDAVAFNTDSEPSQALLINRIKRFLKSQLLDADREKQRRLTLDAAAAKELTRESKFATVTDSVEIIGDPK